MPILTRKPDANKGDHGALGILGGAPGMVGAAFLCGRTALLSGAGRVYVVRPSLHDGFVLDPITPELMVIDFSLAKSKPINTWAIGPGLGMSDAAHQILADVLNADLPMVIDADGLNLMAEDQALGRQCARRTSDTVITPHPVEASRLLGCSTEQIQQDRGQSAIALAKKFKAIAVLKGFESVIADTDGTTIVNKTGNAGLASGGTGDVLTGLIGALMAQGLPALEAAVVGVKLHGQAAEDLAKKMGGLIGMTASELIPEIRRLINAS